MHVFYAPGYFHKSLEVRLIYGELVIADLAEELAIRAG
jgi:hypothetical protein